MKKNKTIAYLMAATLLVGGTFLGTKALFYDEINNVGEIQISTGDVDIKVLDSSVWTLSRNGAEYKDGTNIKSDQADKDGELPEVSGGNDKFGNTHPLANNLKPGDELTKTVTVQNVGTLMAKLELTKDDTKMAEQLGVLNGLITPTNSDIVDEDGDGLLSPGEKATFTLTLKVDNEDNIHGTDFNKDKVENTKVKLTDAWVLTATQQNERANAGE